jgi:large repetitive protein
VLVAVVLVGTLGVSGSAGSAPPPAPPDPTCSPSPANCAAWHTAQTVTVTWASPPPDVQTSGCSTSTITIDTAGAPVSCTWFNNDGARTTSVNVRRDATAPAASASPSRAPDNNGWYNDELTVAFSGSDGTSGLAGCTAPSSYAGPDTASVTISGTCSDVAGNTSGASVSFKYDDTAPSASGSVSRGPDHNGWYNEGVGVAFSGSDGVSGPVACTGGLNYTGPDSASVTVSGSCSDQAGNSKGASVSFKYDATAPSASGSLSRGPDHNGWHNEGVSVAFSGSDGVSGPVACSGGRNYTGPDSGSVTITGSCSDQAGNSKGASVSFKYDDTAPSASGSASRGPDHNGWYNEGVSVAFSGSDGVSGPVACTGGRNYTGPDSASVTITGSCSDQAGNTNGASFAFKYDATAPSASGSLSRGPDHNGWHNEGVSVAFAGSDGVSGPVACTGGRNYTGPDSASVTVTGSCSDQAGNSRGASVSFKYDATGPAVTASPSRGPDSNGWYNHGLTVGFSGSDELSGLAGCSAPQSYAGPDTASGTVNGSCSDVAGNTNGASFSLKYDATPPSASGSPSRGPDQNGWYNHGLTINFVGDGPSGVACTGGRNYTGPDSASVTIDGSCTDQAGNTGSASFTFRYDATAPSADARLTREPDSNGWYNQGLTIDFSGGDELSGLAACTADRNYTGPDSASVTVNGSCTDEAGNPSGASVSFRYDATPPDVEARPDRKPNAKGWYKSEVRVSFVGTDAISGVDSCAPAATYAGPDARNVAVSGTCRDRAANVSGEARLQLKYDTTEPELTRLRHAKLRGRGIVVRWASDDASTFVVVRRPGRDGARFSTVYTGPEHSLLDREVTAGVAYRYTVTASDEAGNSAAKHLVVRSETRASTRVTSAARPTLTRPAQGARVSVPPLLDWEAVPKATYYNVQLFRDGKKILTAWPAATSLRLERSWRFGGQVQRLEPGRYRWYVWPGFGKRTAGDYGKPLGSRTFVVTGG